PRAPGPAHDPPLPAGRGSRCRAEPRAGGRDEPAVSGRRARTLIGVDAFPVLDGMREKGRRTILVIDDNPWLRDVFREALQGAGYRVVVAEDGGEGLSQSRRGPIDLVITDR